jgi:hypothetical protein
MPSFTIDTTGSPHANLMNELKFNRFRFMNHYCNCGKQLSFAEAMTLQNLLDRLPNIIVSGQMNTELCCWDCRNLTYKNPKIITSCDYPHSTAHRWKPWLWSPLLNCGRQQNVFDGLLKNTWFHPTMEYDSESDESDSESSYDSDDDTDESDDDGLNALEICGEMGNQIFEIKQKLTDGEFKNLMDNLSDLRKSKTRERIIPDPELAEQLEVQQRVIQELREESRKTKELKKGAIILKYSIHKIMDSSKSNNKKIKMLRDLMNADEKKIMSNPLLSDVFPHTEPLVNLNNHLV